MLLPMTLHLCRNVVDVLLVAAAGALHVAQANSHL